jgi:hypothetical protein
MTLAREQKGFNVFRVRKPGRKKDFDYREGRLFRFHRAHRASEAPLNTHSVQNFWLCGKCSEDTPAYVGLRGVVIRNRADVSDPDEACRFVAVA